MSAPPPSSSQGQYGQIFDPHTGAPPPSSEGPITRWEKALMVTSAIVQKVSKADPDGIDIYCFPGGDSHVDVYKDVTDVESLQDGLVNAAPPSGKCYMGYAVDMAFKDAFTKGFDKPCTILVITAGRPDDHEQLVTNIKNASKNLQSDKQMSITFVQVGDDEWATTYLKYLDDHLDCMDAQGKKIDIVDTIKDEDIKKAVKEMKEPNFMNSGGGGGLLGGFMGAAMGVGGVYLHNKMQAKKRTKGWNGNWKVIQKGEEVAQIKVEDDMAGNLTIIDDPIYTGGSYAETEEGYNIVKTTDSGKTIKGNIEEDGHDIEWSDGTSWEEIPPEGASWKAYTGAAVGGAAAGGAVGYLSQKKFFNHCSSKCKDNYVIIIDRSEKMAVADYSK